MSCARKNWLRFLGQTLSVGLAVGGAGASLHAGEAIQFSNPNAKSGPAPTLGTRLTDQKASPLDRLPSVNPYDAAAPGMDLRRRRDPKEEKRLRNERLEKENWMVLDKGELQEKDDEETSFGIRDYSADTLEKKEKTAGDIWFAPKQDRGSKAPGSPRSSGNFTRGPGKAASQAETKADDRPSVLSVGRIAAPENVAGPVSSGGVDLSLKSLIMPESGNPVTKDLLGVGGNGNRSLDDKDRGIGLRSLDGQSSRQIGLESDLGRSGPSPLFDAPKVQPALPPSSLSSRLGQGLDSSPKMDLTPTRNSTAPLNAPRTDYGPASPRDIFAPPPRPGSIGR